MFILREALHSFLHILMSVGFVCAVIFWFRGVILSFRASSMRWDESKKLRRGFLSLRRPLPSEFSKEYYAALRQRLWSFLGFLAAIVTTALLSLLDRLLSYTVN
jgi:hypothetical protein